MFYAIPEKVNESCDATLKQFFVDELGVTEDVEIARAHRMGKQETGKTRPIFGNLILNWPKLLRPFKTVFFTLYRCVCVRYGILHHFRYKEVRLNFLFVF